MSLPPFPVKDTITILAFALYVSIIIPFLVELVTERKHGNRAARARRYLHATRGR